MGAQISQSLLVNLLQWLSQRFRLFWKILWSTFRVLLKFCVFLLLMPKFKPLHCVIYTLHEYAIYSWCRLLCCPGKNPFGTFYEGVSEAELFIFYTNTTRHSDTVSNRNVLYWMYFVSLKTANILPTQKTPIGLCSHHRQTRRKQQKNPNSKQLCSLLKRFKLPRQSMFSFRSFSTIPHSHSSQFAKCTHDCNMQVFMSSITKCFNNGTMA